MKSLSPNVKERNYRKEPFTKAELTALVNAVEDLSTILNTRHAVAKKKGWDKKPPSKATFVIAALEEPNLLKRPIVRRGGKAIYSRKEDEIRAFLK